MRISSVSSLNRRAVEQKKESTNRRRAFTLIEVMIAVGIFFSCMFAILLLVSNSLRHAQALQRPEIDASMVAAELSMTNRLYEGGASGDFGDMIADGSWEYEVREVSSNGFFQVDFLVTRTVGRQKVHTPMSIWLYRPESPRGSASGGMTR